MLSLLYFCSTSRSKRGRELPAGDEWSSVRARLPLQQPDHQRYHPEVSEQKRLSAPHQYVHYTTLTQLCLKSSRHNGLLCYWGKILRQQEAEPNWLMISFRFFCFSSWNSEIFCGLVLRRYTVGSGLILVCRLIL